MQLWVRPVFIKNKMLNGTNPFDDDHNDTVIDGGREGRRGITPASVPALFSTWMTADATPPFQNPPGRKSNTKDKMPMNPFDDDDDDTVTDGSREGGRGITPVSFPASLSSWTTADTTLPLHNSPGEVDDDVTWYHDCNVFFTTFTSKCWNNVIESTNRCSDWIATPGVPGRKENIKIKMQNTTNPFDDDDNDTVIDDSWE